MTAPNFRSLVKNFTALKAEEVATLLSLAKEFPYSQLLHVVVARGTRDFSSFEQQSSLHRAAIYATDRSVVKHVMTAPAQARLAEVVAEPIPVIAPEPAAVPKVVKQTIAPVPAPVAKVVEVRTPIVPTPTQRSPVINLEDEALRQDLSKELDKLQHLKHDFEAMYEAMKKQPGVPIKKATAKEPVPDIAASPEAPLIEEIKATRKKLKVPSPKVAEQGEIIDQFIKVVPSMPKAKPGQPDTDLAADSVNYSDHIVSETLVGILLKQGKKAKAIEMLKKLIWKFPQKKAYFAAQIEALKN